jgi:hypothetical protein
MYGYLDSIKIGSENVENGKGIILIKVIGGSRKLSSNTRGV